MTDLKQLDFTVCSDSYIRCILDWLYVLRKEVLNRMGGNK